MNLINFITISLLFLASCSKNNGGNPAAVSNQPKAPTETIVDLGELKAEIQRTGSVFNIVLPQNQDNKLSYVVDKGTMISEKIRIYNDGVVINNISVDASDATNYLVSVDCPSPLAKFQSCLIDIKFISKDKNYGSMYSGLIKVTANGVESEINLEAIINPQESTSELNPSIFLGTIPAQGSKNGSLGIQNNREIVTLDKSNLALIQASSNCTNQSSSCSVSFSLNYNESKKGQKITERLVVQVGSQSQEYVFSAVMSGMNPDNNVLFVKNLTNIKKFGVVSNSQTVTKIIELYNSTPYNLNNLLVSVEPPYSITSSSCSNLNKSSWCNVVVSLSNLGIYTGNLNSELKISNSLSKTVINLSAEVFQEVIACTPQNSNINNAATVTGNIPTCIVDSCSSGFSVDVSENSCVPSSLSCISGDSLGSAGTKTFNSILDDYDSCVVSSCPNGYSINSSQNGCQGNLCSVVDSNLLTAAPLNLILDHSTLQGAYPSCSLNCDNNYTLSSNSKSCIEKQCAALTAQELAGVGFNSTNGVISGTAVSGCSLVCDTNYESSTTLGITSCEPRSCTTADVLNAATVLGDKVTGCTANTCIAGYHKMNGQCEENIISCNITNGSGTKTWNGLDYGACSIASCNSGFYDNGAACVAQICTPNSNTACLITNGNGTTQCNTQGSAYGICNLASCNAGFHTNGNACEANVVACSTANGSGTKTWNGTSYDACLLNSCNNGYYLSGTSCTAQSCTPATTQSCTITNGTGSQTCDAQGSAYSLCSLATCSIGFHPNGNVCENNTQSCTITNGTGTKTWNVSSYGPCSIASCNSGFYDNGSSCVAQACLPNSVNTCPITNGTGSQTCDALGSSYNNCSLTTCNFGYKVDGSSCVVKTCSEATTAELTQAGFNKNNGTISGNLSNQCSLVCDTNYSVGTNTGITSCSPTMCLPADIQYSTAVTGNKVTGCEATTCIGGYVVNATTKLCEVDPLALNAVNKNESIQNGSYIPLSIDYKQLITTNNSNYTNVTFSVLSNTLTNGGTFSCSTASTCLFAPTTLGTYSLVVKGTRATGETATATLTVEVFGSDNVPVFNPLAKQEITVEQGESITFNLHPATSDGDPIRYELIGLPDQGTLSECLNLPLSDSADTDLSCKYEATGNLFRLNFFYKAINTFNNKYAIKEVQIDIFDASATLDAFPAQSASLALNSQGFIFGRGLNSSKLFGVPADYVASTYVFEGSDTVKVPLPDKVEKLYVKKDVAIAKLRNGQFFVWGNEVTAKLSLGSSNILTPVEAPQLTAKNFTNIVIGERASCGIDSLLDVYCWGSNDLGELGTTIQTPNGTGTTYLQKVSFGLNALSQPRKASKIIETSVAASHNCAIVESELYCWGQNDLGQLGIGRNNTDVPSTNIATKVLLPQTVKDATIGEKFACAILADDSVRCWGRNNNGQLGLGDIITRGETISSMTSLPAVSLGEGAKKIMAGAGGSSVCAILLSDKVKCWGRNTSGELGIRDFTNRGISSSDMGSALPYLQDLNNVDIKAITIKSSGSSDFCIQTNEMTSRVFCWGLNNSKSISSTSPFVPSYPQEYFMTPGEAKPYLAPNPIISIPFLVNQDSNKLFSTMTITQFKDIHTPVADLLYFFDATNVNLYTGVVYDINNPSVVAGSIPLSCLNGVKYSSLINCTFTASPGYKGLFDINYYACSPNLSCSGTKVKIQGRVVDPILPYYEDFNTEIAYTILPYQKQSFRLPEPKDPQGKYVGNVHVNLEKSPENAGHYLVRDEDGKIAGAVTGCALAYSPNFNGSYYSNYWLQARDCVFHPKENFHSTAYIEYRAVNITGQSSEIRRYKITVQQDIGTDILHFAGFYDSNTPSQAYRNPELAVTSWYSSLYLGLGKANNTLANQYTYVEPYPSAIYSSYINDLPILPAPVAAPAQFFTKVNGLNSSLYNTCAIIGDNKELMCWGASYSSFTPNNNSSSIYRKVVNKNKDGFLNNVQKASIGTGSMGCAIVGVDKEVVCWGSGAFGCGERTGGAVRTVANQYVPCSVQKEDTLVLNNAIDISVGNQSACAITDNNGVKNLYCWGIKLDANGAGTATSLGSTNLAVGNFRDSARLMTTVSSPTSVTVGDNAACATSANNELYCFGHNQYSQIKTNDSSLVFDPTLIKIASNNLLVKSGSLTVNANYSCAIGLDNKLYCWGYSSESVASAVVGATGMFAIKEVAIPVGNYTQLASTTNSMCIKNNLNNLMCWGVNTNGKLGESATNISYLNASYRKVSPQGSLLAVKDFSLTNNNIFFSSTSLIKNQDWYQENTEIINIDENTTSPFALNLFDNASVNEEFTIIRRPYSNFAIISAGNNYGEIVIQPKVSLTLEQDSVIDYILYIKNNDPSVVYKKWIKVNSSNNKPVARDYETAIGYPANFYFYQHVLATDSDSSSVLSVKIHSVPQYGTINCSTPNTINNTYFSSCYYTSTAAGENHEENISFSFFDGFNYSEIKNVKLKISQLNQTIIGTDTQSFNISPYESLSFKPNKATSTAYEGVAHEIVSGVVNDSGVWKVYSTDNQYAGKMAAGCSLNSTSVTNCVYTPRRGFEGQVSIVYRGKYNGYASSETAEIIINVSKSNIIKAPYVIGQISNESGKYEVESYIYRLQGGTVPANRYGEINPIPLINTINELQNVNAPETVGSYSSNQHIFEKNVQELSLADNSLSGCFLTNGEVNCFGVGNTYPSKGYIYAYGTYPSDSISYSIYKSDVTKLTGAKSVSSSNGQSCAVVGANNAAWCWGRTTSTDVANTTVRPSSGCGSYDSLTRKGFACQIVKEGHTPLINIKSVVARQKTSCAIVEENSKGQVYCWGYKIDGFNNLDESSRANADDPKYTSNFAQKINSLENEDIISLTSSKLDGDTFCATNVIGVINCFGNPYRSFDSLTTLSQGYVPAKSLILGADTVSTATLVHSVLGDKVILKTNSLPLAANFINHTVTASDSSAVDVVTRRDVSGSTVTLVWEIKMRADSYSATLNYNDGTSVVAATATMNPIYAKPNTLQGSNSLYCANAKITNDLYCWGADDVGSLKEQYSSTNFVNSKPSKIIWASNLTYKNIKVANGNTCWTNIDDELTCTGSNIYAKVGVESGYNQTNPYSVAGFVSLDNAKTIKSKINGAAVKVSDFYITDKNIVLLSNGPIDINIDIEPEEFNVLKNESIGGLLGVTDPMNYEYELIDKPASGKITGDLNNLVYTPNNNFTGTETVTYKVFDKSGNFSYIKTIIIKVAASNSAPVAGNKTLYVKKNETLNIQLPGSDDTTAYHLLNYTILTPPTKTELFTPIGGSYYYSYKTTASATGTDSFSYSISDGNKVSNIGTITINIVEDGKPLLSEVSKNFFINKNEVKKKIVLPRGYNVHNDYDAEPSNYILTMTPSVFKDFDKTVYLKSGNDKIVKITGCFVNDGLNVRNCYFTLLKPDFVGNLSFSYKAQHGALVSQGETQINLAINQTNPNMIYALGNVPNNYLTGFFEINSQEYRYLGGDIGNFSLPAIVSAEVYPFPVRHDNVDVSNTSTMASYSDNYCIASNIGDKPIYCTGTSGNGIIGRFPLAYNNYTSPDQSFNKISFVHSALGFVSNVKKMELGLKNACAILSDDTLACWGGTIDTDVQPTYLNKTGCGFIGSITKNGDACKIVNDRNEDITNVVDVAVNKYQGGYDYQSSCLIKNEGGVGKVYCWGDDISSPNFSSSTPKLRPSLSTKSAINIEFISFGVCVAYTDGTVMCEGKNDNSISAMGIGTPTNTIVSATQLVFKDSLNNNVAIKPETLKSYGNRLCVLDQNDYLQCWGVANSGIFSTPGQPITNYVYNPKILMPSKKVKTFDLTDNELCIIDLNDEVFCWGDNYYGQLGNEKYSYDRNNTSLFNDTRTLAVTESASIKKYIDKQPVKASALHLLENNLFITVDEDNIFDVEVIEAQTERIEFSDENPINLNLLLGETGDNIYYVYSRPYLSSVTGTRDNLNVFLNPTLSDNYLSELVYMIQDLLTGKVVFKRYIFAVTVFNQAPKFTNQTVRVSSGKTVNFYLSGTDVDLPYSSQLTYQVITGPSAGTLNNCLSNYCTFVAPVVATNTTYTVVARVTDDKGKVNLVDGIITIEVLANAFPYFDTLSANYSLVSGEKTLIISLPMAKDPNNKTLIYTQENSSVKPVLDGSVMVNMIYDSTNSSIPAGTLSDCVFAYAPIAGDLTCRFTVKPTFNGTAKFQYLATNGTEASEVVTITIDVLANTLVNKVYMLGYEAATTDKNKVAGQEELRTPWIANFQEGSILEANGNQKFVSGVKDIVSYSNQNLCIQRSDNKVACFIPGGTSNGMYGFMSAAYGAYDPTGAYIRFNSMTDETKNATQTEIKQFRIGSNQTCSIVGVENKIICWGTNPATAVSNMKSGCGFNTTITDTGVPCNVVLTNEAALVDVKKIELADQFGCAIVNENSLGKVYCWGYKLDGLNGQQFALPSETYTNNHARLLASLADKDIAEIKLGNKFGCAISTDKKVYCWGLNNSGVLGKNEAANNLAYPAREVVIDDQSVIISAKIGSLSISPTQNQVCVTGDVNNQLYCWGTSGMKYPDGSTVKLLPTKMTIPASINLPIKRVSSNAQNNIHCILDNNSHLWCWGYNNYGTLGSNLNKGTSTEVPQSAPVRMMKADNVTPMLIKDYELHGTYQLFILEDQ